MSANGVGAVWKATLSRVVRPRRSAISHVQSVTALCTMRRPPPRTNGMNKPP
ncbi:MAG: hypothetical protein MUC99_04620 [Anaerolineae bacterium]|nr:hypothetical protein [Anaerolineae bacterium]